MSSDDMPKTFRVSRKKAVGLFVLASVFVAVGVVMVADGIAFGWVGIAFFGLGVPLSVWQLVAPGSLTIDETSIEVRDYWWLRRHRLADCGEFRPWDAGTELVVFDYHGEPRPRSARWGKQHLGFTDSLPDTYGLGAHKLSALLNTVRAKLARRVDRAELPLGTTTPGRAVCACDRRPLQDDLPPAVPRRRGRRA